MQEEDLLFIVSDHGFGPCDNYICINNILKKCGFIKTKYTLKSLNKNKDEHLKKILKKDNNSKNSLMSHLFREILNNFFLKYVFYKLGNLNKKIKKKYLKCYIETIDFKKSIAYVPTEETMGIYINKNKEIRDVLIEKLKNLKYNDIQIFKNILKREDIYDGQFTELGPDILMIPDNFYITSWIRDKIIVPYPLFSFHKINGIFAAYGSKIKKGNQKECFNIYDIAPTILHIFNLPIPFDMDGVVLKAIFKEGTQFANRSVKRSIEEFKIKKNISELIYLNKL